MFLGMKIFESNLRWWSCYCVCKTLIVHAIPRISRMHATVYSYWPIKLFPAHVQNAEFWLVAQTITKLPPSVPLVSLNNVLFWYLFHLNAPTYKIHNILIFNPNFMRIFALCSSGSLVFNHDFSRIFGWLDFKWY